MAHRDDDGRESASSGDGEASGGSDDLSRFVLGPREADKSESLVTVLVAFGINVLIAVAKSVAALVTGSASLVAEAAHSWADAGNEIFLLAADRRARRPPDASHPYGHGREAYVWSLFAALGLFVAGAGGVRHARHSGTPSS